MYRYHYDVLERYVKDLLQQEKKINGLAQINKTSFLRDYSIFFCDPKSMMKLKKNDWMPFALEIERICKEMGDKLLLQRENTWGPILKYKKVNLLHRLCPLDFDLEDFGDCMLIKSAPESSCMAWRGMMFNISHPNTVDWLELRLRSFEEKGYLLTEIDEKALAIFKQVFKEAEDMRIAQGIPDWNDFSVYSF